MHNANGSALAPNDMPNTVIAFHPATGARVRAGEFRLYMHAKQFDPQVLTIPVGSTVHFPNQDAFLHNVFSVSAIAPFDLGYYGSGSDATYTFNKPGVALIYCNVHNTMQADVFVLDTPYFAHPDGQGRFRIAGLPPGAGTLSVWNPRASPWKKSVSIPSTKLAIDLTLIRPLLMQHANKANNAY